jgi:uncharacterized OsmC-like protein
MQDFPHYYRVNASAETEGNILLKEEGLPQIVSAAPAEFGGPGDQWSPEHLLVAAVGDCFVLTFRAIARASKLDWVALQVDTVGVLDRVERVTRFTEFRLHARLTVAPDVDTHKARHVLEKSEAVCLVTNSMTSSTHLETEVISSS